jgi:hypothetical protein
VKPFFELNPSFSGDARLRPSCEAQVRGKAGEPTATTQKSFEGFSGLLPQDGIGLQPMLFLDFFGL